MSRQPKGLAGWLKSPGTATRGLIALLEATHDNWAIAGEMGNSREKGEMGERVYSTVSIMSARVFHVGGGIMW